MQRIPGASAEVAAVLVVVVMATALLLGQARSRPRAVFAATTTVADFYGWALRGAPSVCELPITFLGLYRFKHR